MRRQFLPFVLLMMLIVSCSKQEPLVNFSIESINRYTPVKDQGESQSCWIYAMLAAIETEHIMQGDSVNLSPAFVQKMLDENGYDGARQRGMGITLIRLIHRYGIVPYQAMRTTKVAPPQYAFMLGAQYTPQEFARSVCAPDEYVALTSDSDEPYYQQVDIDLPDNWLHDRFLNVPSDSLLAIALRAVRQGHGICWESQEHAMAIVGLGRDEAGNEGFVLKNSWGTRLRRDGLAFLSFSDFLEKTLAITLPRAAI